MSTWTTPNNVIQYCEVPEHISWRDADLGLIKYNDGRFLLTTLPLLHIANTLTHDLKMKTYYILATGFNFGTVPSTLTTVEAQLVMKRGRITDDTIQLSYNGQAIGNNQADFKLDPIKTYGGTVDVWNYNLTSAMVSDPSFGLLLRFQSHPDWPHNEVPRLDCVMLRVS